MAKYNLQPYNLNENYRYLWFDRFLADVVECVAGTKRMIFFQMSIGDVIRGNSRLKIMIYKTAEYGDIVNSKSRMMIIIPMDKLLADLMLQNSYIAKNLTFGGYLSDRVLSGLYIGKIIVYKVNLSDGVNKLIRIAKRMWFSRADYNAIMASINAYTIVIVTGVFQGVIRNGQTLVINSENYTVTLDGANVINQYSGDWIFITPELIDVKISTSSGLPMQGPIEYIERYI